MKQIEQVLNNKIVIDYDEILSKSQIIETLKQDFNISNNNNPYKCTIKNKEINLFVKQITYLGNPHLDFKKRIQLSKGWETELKNENSFLVGLYKYKLTLIYVFFDKKNFLNRSLNNSSAHISTFDLLKASQSKIFSKTDIRGNLITAVCGDFALSYLEKLITNEDISNPEIELFETFKTTLQQKYSGLECYSEMIKNNFKNKFQPEWAGFFLEFKFQDFLNKNPNLQLICSLQSNKKKGEIDLDLNFNNQFLGDLKAHSNTVTALLGNDKSNIELALRIYNKIWYVVFNHDTQKDSEKKYEVTHFWNKQQNKNNLMSYSEKMKNNITFTDFKILEINTYNQQYLSDFNQGKNSNGLERAIKIKIDKKHINNFLIHYSVF